MRDEQTTEQTVKIELLSRWKLEAEFRNICIKIVQIFVTLWFNLIQYRKIHKIYSNYFEYLMQRRFEIAFTFPPRAPSRPVANNILI